ncbi:hypothetical protein RD792_002754 [Penstemon davidsonii]|uniref:Uncharacterized protein n=1 Tax=Penstemon davidsonii TaxID=160366 RepID=A0ABR0DRV7_9LAMI|nr:hypothetical protein RD792_002754 [Penstemon davidsonii]
MVVSKFPLGCEPVVGYLTPSKKREYRVTNILQEGKRPIYAVVFNFIDSRYFNAFDTAGDGTPFLVAGGLNGIIGVIDTGNEKIYKDFHLSDIYRIASCGMDNTVKIWSMKAMINDLVLWEPKMEDQSPGEGTVDILQKYLVPECDIWFIKFSCDFHHKTAAVGNRDERYMYGKFNPTHRLSHLQSKSAIRLTAMSFDEAQYSAAVKMEQYGSGML